MKMVKCTYCPQGGGFSWSEGWRMSRDWSLDGCRSGYWSRNWKRQIIISEN